MSAVDFDASDFLRAVFLFAIACLQESFQKGTLFLAFLLGLVFGMVLSQMSERDFIKSWKRVLGLPGSPVVMSVIHNDSNSS